MTTQYSLEEKVVLKWAEEVKDDTPFIKCSKLVAAIKSGQVTDQACVYLNYLPVAHSTRAIAALAYARVKDMPVKAAQDELNAMVG